MRVTNTSHTAILDNVSRTISLSAKEEALFLSFLREKNFPSKAGVLAAGEICGHQHFVVNGCLKVFYLDENGLEHIVKFAIENWWAFDIKSFFEQAPAFYGISCIEDTRVLQLSKEKYETLMSEIPAFEKFYRIMMQNSFIALQHRMTQSLSLRAEERYHRFQEKYPGLEKRVSQKQIASYLGITPVFLSMLRKQDLVKH